MTYLLDSNILIDYLRGDKKIAEFLYNLEETNANILISVITEYELLCGKDINNSIKSQKISELLSLFPPIDVNSEIVKISAKFYRNYNSGIADAIIAGTTFYTNSTLITRNTKHFINIKEIKIESV